METSPTPRPALDLANQLHYQLVYTLTDLLPPPLDDSPAALRARNHAAIAKVAALLPVNANEIDLAAQCIAARAQAEEMLRLIRQNTHDIGLVMRLNAQYASMVRTSLSVQGRLMRVQAVRQKREAIEGAASQDAWTLHVAEQSMLKVADPGAKPRQPAAPAAAPVGVPAAGLDQKIEKNVPDSGTVSQDMPFETRMSAQPRNRGSTGSGETGLRAPVREAMADSRLRGRESSANGRQSPGIAGWSGIAVECPDGAPSRPFLMRAAPASHPKRPVDALSNPVTGGRGTYASPRQPAKTTGTRN